MLATEKETLVLGIDCGETNMAMVVLSNKDPYMPISMKHLNLNQRFHIRGKSVDKMSWFEVIDDLFRDLEAENLLGNISLVVIEHQMQRRFTLQMHAFMARVHYMHPDKVCRVAHPTKVKKFVGLEASGDHSTNKSRMLKRVKMVLNRRAVKRLEAFPIGQSDIADAYSYALYGVLDYDNLIVHNPRGMDAVDLEQKAKDRLDRLFIGLASAQVRYDQYVAFRELKMLDPSKTRTARKNALKRVRQKENKTKLGDIRDELAGDTLPLSKKHVHSASDLVET